VSAHPILSRLDTGRPLLVSADPVASLRDRGVELHGPAALGRLLREHPTVVREHYHQEIVAGVDVLCCLTGDTIPRALQQIGMPFRSAALTGDAVELALEAADLTPRPLIVAGVLGNTEVPPVAEDRVDEELGDHASRLAAAGCELLLARGFGHDEGSQSHGALSRRAALASAARMQLPTWALVAIDWSGFTSDGMPADEVALRVFEQGAQVALFEIPGAEIGLGWVDRLLAICAASQRDMDASSARHLGFALASSALDPDLWAHEARRLLEAGVRVIGGGRGTTQRHLAALSGLLRGHERKSRWPPPVPRAV
jgi:5-methyltetrahydrofolate--homocysteine methyltransferase